MSRRLLKKITPNPAKLQNRWFLKVFGQRIADPRMLSLQRRSITAAFGVGLAICFIPLPIHLPLAALIAIMARINVPTIIGTVFLVNPFTVVPVFYTAYRVGCRVLDVAPRHFNFKFDFDWLQYGLGPMWRPFLLGCLICSVLAGLLGWLGLETIWRTSVRARYRARRPTSTP
jgi:uncharacterized protein (DUF2062 family)